MVTKGATTTLDSWKQEVEITYNKYKPELTTLDVVLVVTSILTFGMQKKKLFISFLTLVSVLTLTKLYFFERLLQIHFTLAEFVSWFLSFFALFYAFTRKETGDDLFYPLKLFGIIGLVSSLYLTLDLHDTGFDAERVIKSVAFITYTIFA